MAQASTPAEPHLTQPHIYFPSIVGTKQHDGYIPGLLIHPQVWEGAITVSFTKEAPASQILRAMPKSYIVSRWQSWALNDINRIAD